MYVYDQDNRNFFDDLVLPIIIPTVTNVSSPNTIFIAAAMASVREREREREGACVCVAAKRGKSRNELLSEDHCLLRLNALYSTLRRDYPAFVK